MSFESVKNIDYNFKFKTAPTIAGLVVLKTKLENVSWVLDKADFELCRIKGLQCRQGIDQDGVYNIKLPRGFSFVGIIRCSLS